MYCRAQAAEGELRHHTSKKRSFERLSKREIKRALRTGNAHGICTGFERDLNRNGRTVHGKFFFTHTVCRGCGIHVIYEYTSTRVERCRSKLIYEQEMKRGHFELVVDKVVMCGIAGSGKTSSLHVLLGRPPPDSRNTPLMKRPAEVMFMCVNDKKEWKVRTLEEMRDTVAEIIRSRMPKQQTEAQSSGSPASPGQQPSPTTDSQSPKPTPQKTSTSTSQTVEKSTPSSENKSTDSRVQSEEEGEKGSLDSVLKSSEVDEEYVSLINNAPPSRDPIMRVRQILMLDSGGQPPFHESLPVFLKGASKFMYIFKVHESLKDRSLIQYFKDGKLVGQFPASLTNEDTLKLLTRSMRSLNTKNPNMPPSKLLFLATHRDKVADEKLPGVLDALHKKLREILLPQFKDQLIYCHEKGKDFIFTLNTARPMKKDKECAAAIRECLNREDEGRKVVKAPLRWYTLYQKLVEVVVGLGKKVLSRDQCRQVAESMEIEDESCEECLVFFDGLNALFYFPDILPHLVFLEPQMLLDKVSELVEESYCMSQGEELKATSGDRLKLYKYGQVTERFLSEFESHYEPPLFTPKELITLMKGLLVFADLSEGVYFMPCLLQVVSSEVVSRYRVSGEKALALHFPDSGPLMGMFCSTVAYLLSPENAHPCPWKVVENEAGTPECLNRNVIKFSVSDIAGAVSLVDHFTHFEIHVRTYPKKMAELWQLAHDAVFAGLKKAEKTIGYKNTTPVPAIVCPYCSDSHPLPPHPGTPHPATFNKDRVYKCTQNPERYGDIDDTIPWLSLCGLPRKSYRW